MNHSEVLSALEAVLMVSEEPVPAQVLADALDISAEEATIALEELRAEYDGESGGRQRGFELRNVAGGWRIYSRPRWAKTVGVFVVGEDTAQLSLPALETLAIVAYRQPVTRLQVSQVRGVNVDSVMRKLQARGLIQEEGVSETGAYLYGTTPYFLELMGFETLDQLEPLAPFLPEAGQLDSLTIETEE